jgi:carboxypeptidase Q
MTRRRVDFAPKLAKGVDEHHMNRNRLLAAAGLLALAIPLAGQSAFDIAVSRRLAGAILVEGRSYEYVSELTGTFGSRLTGSPAYQGAAEWAIAQFTAAGVRAVGTEPFTIARGWQRGAARARMVVPLDRPVHVESLGWMPSTPDGGVEGDVVLVRDLAPGTVAASSLKGRIVLMAQSDAGDLAAHLTRRDRIDERLREAGALAVIWPESGPGNVLAARAAGFGTDIGALPSGQIGRDDAQLIRRLLDQGPVRIALELHNRISADPVVVNNVIAEIRGRQRPDDWVIVGAHLDSWDFATGAQDNGTGVAMVLEAARAIAALGRPPRRSIRFALWGGEEQGLVGSLAYLRAHDTDLSRCIANINTDGGSGRVLGFLTPGRADVAAALRPLSQALLADLGAADVDQSMRYAFQSDDGPFILHGIPALDLNPDDAPYEAVHHTASDTLDKVDRHDLAIGAAAVAIAAYAIADAERPIAPRLDRAAIARMLAAARMERLLRAKGLWEPVS